MRIGLHNIDLVIQYNGYFKGENEMGKYYPEYIKEGIKDRLDLDESIETDEEIFHMAPNAAFKNYTTWKLGHQDWSSQIKEWVKDIYGIDLDDVSENPQKYDSVLMK